MIRQYTYIVATRYYENGDMDEPRGMRLRVRASDEDRASLAARQATQRILAKRDQPYALNDITVIEVKLW